MSRTIAALGLALALVNASSAFAKCNVVGTWNQAINGTAESPFVMKTNKIGSAGANALCNNAATKVTTTKLKGTSWAYNFSSKGCTVVDQIAVTFAGSCNTTSGETASGTITIPGYGTFPYTLTKQ